MSKYKNVPTVVDNVRFASKKEAARYQELKLLQKAGDICNLELQPNFVLEANGQKICTYRGDFQYLKYYENGDAVIVEDVKGHRTEVYKLKKRLMRVLKGIEIQEI